MKRHPSRPKAVIMAAVLLFAAAHGGAATYYVNAAQGNDANAGTSPQSPFQTLARAGSLRLQPGDQVLLAATQTFAGQLAYEGLAGTTSQPIVISSYPAATAGSDGHAIIDAKGYGAGVSLKNCAHVEIGNLLVTANAGVMKPEKSGRQEMRCGILIEADQPGTYAGFVITNVIVKDIFYESPGFVRAPNEVKTANGTQSYGWGIRFMTESSHTVMRDLFITDCQIENIEHTGLKLTAASNGLQHVEVQRVRIAQTGGPGVQMSGVHGGHFSALDVNGSGSKNDTRKWGRGSGLWTWGSSDVVIEKSRFQNANGPGDSAGVHIDFNCRNVIVQYNFSANNAGGFCEILGNNYNCAYRYNVSVNDGYRVKGKNGAFQEGKIFWLSGYTGENHPRRGPFNSYFYNNTIYVAADREAKVALTDTADGVLIANNIFCFKGRSRLVAGDQFRPDQGKTKGLKHVVFRNNLFLRADNWPAELTLRDGAPIFGNPDFCNAGGLRLEDYLPLNAKLVSNRGIRIPKIPQDEIGLVGGLEMEYDILGNKIVGPPDLGAVEISAQSLPER